MFKSEVGGYKMLTGINGQKLMVQPQTFQWGKEGSIEMRPIEDVARSSWVRQPSTSQAQAIEVEPDKILGQQLEQAMQQTKADYEIMRKQLTADTDNRLQTLEREQQIKKEALVAKYGRNPNPEMREKYNQDLLNLDTQHAIAIERITGKIRPDLEALNMQTQQSVAELNKAFEQKQIRLQTIKNLQEKGLIDPAASMQEQYQLAGISLPLSAFQEKMQTPRQQLNELKAYINLLEEETEIGQYEYSPEEDRMIPKTIDPTLQIYLQELKDRRVKLLKQVMPQYTGAAEKSNQLSRAGTRALVGDGEMGGTLAGRVVVEKNKFANQTPEKKQEPMYARNPQTGQRIVSYDGGESWQIAQ